MRYRCPRPTERPWQRIAAGVQAVAVALTLAPASGLRRQGRTMAPIGAIGQTTSVATTIRRTLPAAARDAFIRSKGVAPVFGDHQAARDRASA